MECQGNDRLGKEETEEMDEEEGCGDLGIVREDGVRHKPHGVSDGENLQLFLFWSGRQLVRYCSHLPHLYPIRYLAFLDGKGSILGSIHTCANLL